MREEQRRSSPGFCISDFRIGRVFVLPPGRDVNPLEVFEKCVLRSRACASAPPWRVFRGDQEFIKASKMRYGQIRKYDVANGPGIRTTIFVTGCTHHCKGCFNELYMDFEYGSPWTDVQTNLVLDCLEESMIAGITVLGGEPMQNIDGLLDVLSKVRSRISGKSPADEIGGERKNVCDLCDRVVEKRQEELRGKTIWIYSGYTFEEILEDPGKVELLSLCDVLVDGRFVEELKNLRLRFRGSENQRVLSVPESLKQRKPVFLPGYERDER